MLRRFVIDCHCEEILDYCRSRGIAILQSRSYQLGAQTLSWHIYCEDSPQLDLLLLKYGRCITAV